MSSPACFPGYFLAVGFTDGSVHILDAISLQSFCKEFKFSQGPVTHVSFSHDSEYFATAVSLVFPLYGFHVLLMVQLSVGLGIAAHPGGPAERAVARAVPLLRLRDSEMLFLAWRVPV